MQELIAGHPSLGEAILRALAHEPAESSEQRSISTRRHVARTSPHLVESQGMESHPSVLVTDGFHRKALSATRSLGAAGFRVVVCERSVVNPARFSRYASRALRSPASEDAATYRSWLKSMVEEHRLAAILPIDELATSIVVHDPIDGAACLVPTPEQFETCRDKFQTVALAKRAGVPVPHAISVSSLEEAKQALSDIGGPAVIKARQSSGGRGVSFIDTCEELEAKWPFFADTAPYLQERIPLGRKFDVGLLFDDEGVLRREFVQEELRWYPTEVSVSTVQRSVHRPDLVDLALRTLEPIGWRGIVELEYIEDASGTPWLLEINPRLWSSVDLAVQCGIDFATLSLQLALGQDIPPDTGYSSDVFCTWSLPGEMLRRTAAFLRGDRQGSKRACPRGTHDNIVSTSDPGPIVGVILTVFRHIMDLSLWQQFLRRP